MCVRDLSRKTVSCGHGGCVPPWALCRPENQGPMTEVREGRRRPASSSAGRRNPTSSACCPTQASMGWMGPMHTGQGRLHEPVQLFKRSSHLASPAHTPRREFNLGTPMEPGWASCPYNEASPDFRFRVESGRRSLGDKDASPGVRCGSVSVQGRILVT